MGGRNGQIGKWAKERGGKRPRSRSRAFPKPMRGRLHYSLARWAGRAISGQCLCRPVSLPDAPRHHGACARSVPRVRDGVRGCSVVVRVVVEVSHPSMKSQGGSRQRTERGQGKALHLFACRGDCPCERMKRNEGGDKPQMLSLVPLEVEGRRGFRPEQAAPHHMVGEIA